MHRYTSSAINHGGEKGVSRLQLPEHYLLERVAGLEGPWAASFAPSGHGKPGRRFAQAIEARHPEPGQSGCWRWTQPPIDDATANIRRWGGKKGPWLRDEVSSIKGERQQSGDGAAPLSLNFISRSSFGSGSGEQVASTLTTLHLGPSSDVIRQGTRTPPPLHHALASSSPQQQQAVFNFAGCSPSSALGPSAPRYLIAAPPSNRLVLGV